MQRLSIIMILLNFSHPITKEQRDQIESLTGVAIRRVIVSTPQFDQGQPFAAQTDRMLAAIPLTSEEWQKEPIVVILPSLPSIAALVLAELHGRAGCFLPMVRTRPVTGVTPLRYEVAEILDLQTVRDHARAHRSWIAADNNLRLSVARDSGCPLVHDRCPTEVTT